MPKKNKSDEDIEENLSSSIEAEEEEKEGLIDEDGTSNEIKI